MEDRLEEREPEAEKPPKPRRAPVIASALVVLVFALALGAQLFLERASANRSIGIEIAPADRGVAVTYVEPNGPAAIGGIEEGDVIVLLNALPVDTLATYDIAAAGTSAGFAHIVTVVRDGEELDLAIQPGVPFDFTVWLLNGLVASIHLAFGLVVLLVAGRDLRANLLGVLLVAIGLELVVPGVLVGALWFNTAAACAYWLLTGLEFGVELHLASVIPGPQAWFRRRRWPLVLFYGVGLGFGSLMALASIPGAESNALLRWAQTPAGDHVTGLFFVLWLVGVVGILSNSALNWPHPTGRQQALLVLLGVLPWAALIAGSIYWDFVGAAYPAWFDVAEPVAFFIYPVALVFAIFRYRLFDLEFFVHRSLVYGGVSTILLLAVYVMLALGGVKLASVLEGGPITIAAAACALALGFLYAPLKRVVEGAIDSRLFPERVALRERLGEMVRDLPGRGQLAKMADTLVAELVEIFAVERACLLIADRDSDLLVGRAARYCDEREHGLLFPKSDPFIRFLAERGLATVAERWPRTMILAARIRQMGGAVAVPIMRSGELTGLLILGPRRDGKEFGAEERQLLDLLGHHVATVLENAHLFESATLDGLTGLLRREPVLFEVQREIDRAVRYERPLSVAMIDIDRFKVVNDALGHIAGDVILRQTAEKLAEGLRSTDVLGRYGGEEFLALLPETDRRLSRSVAERMRQAVAGHNVQIEGRAVGVTVSIGIVTLQDLPAGVEPTVEALIEAADASLYEAKREGRNRVAQSTPSPADAVQEH